MVVENFGTWATRARVGHLPEVIGRVTRTLVITNSDDPLGRDADFLRPDIVGFVIFLINGDPQLLFRQTINAGQQLPGKVNGIPFEVIAEAEVAQHFEEGVVTGRIPDVFQVIVLATGTHTALRGCRSCVGTLVLTEKNILELNHARVGEEQGRVIPRNQRTGRHNRVAFGFKETEKLVPDFGAFHNWVILKLIRKSA